jgi:hypothetical protein
MTPRSGRADETLHEIRVLLAGRALDTGGHIDKCRAGHADGSGDRVGGEAARQRKRRSETLKRTPVEGGAVAAGKLGRGVGLGVEENAVGDRGIGARACDIGRRSDRDCFHHRQPGAGLDRCHALSPP